LYFSIVKYLFCKCNMCWENLKRQNRGDLTRMRTELNPHKEMTPVSTQNLKALGLWVFFLVCCSTFSLLLNVGLRLTLGYLTISPSSESPFHIGTLPRAEAFSNTSTLITNDPHLYRRLHT